MIEKLSQSILDYLLNSNAIENNRDEKDYYTYGIQITLSSMLNLLLILGIGFLTFSIIESIIFLMLFIPIRQFTGGFHASTYFKCNLSFCIVFVSILLLYYTTGQYFNTYIAILITFVCVSVILIKCPIENKNKPIPDNRKPFHKTMAAMLGIAYGTIGTVLIAFSNKYGALFLYTLLSVIVLIIAAMLQERRGKNEKVK